MADVPDHLAQLMNASASHEDVQDNGPPAPPLPFPPPTVGRAVRVTAIVYNPAISEEGQVDNVVYEVRPDGSAPVRAYWIGRKLKDAIYGCVKYCTVLKLRQGSRWTGPEPGGGAVWEVTQDTAAVKIVSRNRLQQLRGRHQEDPEKEISALQHTCQQDEHPNVLGTLDALADEQYLYSFMPYCSSGELFDIFKDTVKRRGRFTEQDVRSWFRQLLEGLFHLQKMGVCHRDISFENILVDQMTRAVIIDLGMCLRVPFGADDGIAVVDASAGTLRRLMTPQGRCGKRNYISPEVYRNSQPFDGFAIDVWACGVALFMMLVGIPPFEIPTAEDPCFRIITRGRLMNLLTHWNLPISNEAIDLLQSMLREDPRERLSLTEVKDHPWVNIDDAAVPPPQAADEGWRN